MADGGRRLRETVAWASQCRGVGCAKLAIGAKSYEIAFWGTDVQMQPREGASVELAAAQVTCPRRLECTATAPPAASSRRRRSPRSSLRHFAASTICRLIVLLSIHSCCYSTPACSPITTE